MLLQPFNRILVENMEVASAVIFYKKTYNFNLLFVLSHSRSLCKPVNNLLDYTAI